MCKGVGHGVWLSFLLAVSGQASIPSQTCGPLFHHEQDAIHEETDLAGPFITHKEDTAEKIKEFGFRPLFYRMTIADLDWLEWDSLYPILTYDRIGAESRLQFIQLFAFSNSGRESGVDNKFTLFPLLFIDKTADPKDSYMALFPLYGVIKNRLTFDRIFVVAFPLYGDFKKNGVHTRYYLFPFFSRNFGKDVSGWRFFPFYGYQTKKDAYDKRYILFPFWMSQDQVWDPDDQRHGRASLPLFYHEWTDTRDARTVLWPFLRRVEDHKRDYVEWDFPWPLWVIARGKDYNVTRFVPIYGKSQDQDRRGYMFLFPLWKWNIVDQPDGKVETSRFIFYVFADTMRTHESTREYSRRIDSLPLFQYKREYDGSVSFQSLALLEPVLPGQKSIARDYAPFWTLFEYRRAANGDAMNCVLWNLWRWEKQGDRRQTSFLLGLFQWRKDGERQAIRLLYLPAIRWNNK